MISFFRQPFPSFYPSFHAVGQCAIAGASVFLVLFVLQPFGMNNYTTVNRFVAALGYGIITFLVSILFTCLLPVCFPRIFDETKWTVAKEFVFFILITMAIAIANLFFSHLIDGNEIQFSGLLRSMTVTFSVAFIPVFLAVFFKQQRLFKKYKQESAALNELLKQAKTDTDSSFSTTEPEIPAGGKVLEETAQSNAAIKLTGSNQQESITLLPEQLLMVSAADNYVKVQYADNEKVKQAVLRGALKNFENQLSLYNHLLRCHRSYIINLRKVNAVSGNAQGYKLHVPGLEEPIPVGRNYNTVIKEKLQHLWD